MSGWRHFTPGAIYSRAMKSHVTTQAAVLHSFVTVGPVLGCGLYAGRDVNKQKASKDCNASDPKASTENGSPLSHTLPEKAASATSTSHHNEEPFVHNRDVDIKLQPFEQLVTSTKEALSQHARRAFENRSFNCIVPLPQKLVPPISQTIHPDSPDRPLLELIKNCLGKTDMTSRAISSSSSSSSSTVSGTETAGEDYSPPHSTRMEEEAGIKPLIFDTSSAGSTSTNLKESPTPATGTPTQNPPTSPPATTTTATTTTTTTFDKSSPLCIIDPNERKDVTCSQENYKNSIPGDETNISHHFHNKIGHAPVTTNFSATNQITPKLDANQFQPHCWPPTCTHRSTTNNDNNTGKQDDIRAGNNPASHVQGVATPYDVIKQTAGHSSGGTATTVLPQQIQSLLIHPELLSA